MLQRSSSVDDQHRSQFADFLDRLAVLPSDVAEWSQYVVTHYLDDELENIRCNLVRLSIAGNSAGHPIAWLARDQEQFKQWATCLRTPIKTGMFGDKDDLK